MTHRPPFSRRHPVLLTLALAAVPALLAFWLAGGFLSAPAVDHPVPRPRGVDSRGRTATLPAWSIRRGTMSTLDMVRRLRTASPAELRSAFLSTRDYSLRCAITARWAALDPESCFQTLCETGNRTPSDTGLWWGHMPILFQQWALVDHAAARHALIQEKRGLEFSRTAFIQTCAHLGGEAWSSLLADPQFSMSWEPAAQLPRLGLDPLTPEKAMQIVSTAVQSGRYGMLFQDQVWSAASGGDPQAALTAWRQLPASLRPRFTGKLLEDLAPQDPAAAAAFERELSPAEREMVTGSYAAGLAKKNPQAAWDWLAQNPGSRPAFSASAWGNAVDPSGGAKILAAAAPSASRDAAGSALASQWMQTDAAAASAWLLSLEDPAMKRAAWRGAAGAWVEEAPEQAVAAFLSPGAPPLQPDQVRGIAKQLAISEPELARTFADGLPPFLATAAREELANQKSGAK